MPNDKGDIKSKVVFNPFIVFFVCPGTDNSRVCP